MPIALIPFISLWGLTMIMPFHHVYKLYICVAVAVYNLYIWISIPNSTTSKIWHFSWMVRLWLSPHFTLKRSSCLLLWVAYLLGVNFYRWLCFGYLVVISICVFSYSTETFYYQTCSSKMLYYWISETVLFSAHADLNWCCMAAAKHLLVFRLNRWLLHVNVVWDEIR
jgi:hypothetical protein